MSKDRVLERVEVRKQMANNRNAWIVAQGVDRITGLVWGYWIQPFGGGPEEFVLEPPDGLVPTSGLT